MFLCILANDDFLYYEPSNIYSYNYITKRKEEFKVNDIFPLFAVQIESSLLGLVLVGNLLCGKLIRCGLGCMIIINKYYIGK